MAEILKGKNLVKRQGNNYLKVDPADHLKNKVVALYFSAHWASPCRAFAPILKDFYEQVEGLPFEIVFVSFDRSESELKQFMSEAHGNWAVIPFGDSANQELAKKYGVDGIPALIIIKPNGDIISKNARDDVQDPSGMVPVELVKDWINAAGIKG